ncbi:MAG: spore germination protein [Defluviitaleaceae bacterium]|nr:spore germination protein [Defluviitaleaceae bacterium]
MDTLFYDLEKNISKIESIFGENADLVKRKIQIGDNSHNAYIVFIDGLANSKLIETTVIAPLVMGMKLTGETELNTNDILDFIIKTSILSSDIKKDNNFENIIKGVMCGDTIVFFDKCDSCLVVASRGFNSRGVPSTETEIVVQGPKDAFSESLRTNTMLIRRRIRDENLIISQTNVGTITKTDIAIIYVKSIARETVVSEVFERIKNINTDAILDIGYLEQFIENDYLSPFPQCQVTERPDKAASAVLEGRVVIMSDNSPFVLIVPCFISSFFQSPEDYYSRFEISSLSRIIRYTGAIISTILPGLYLAISLYSPNMLPKELLLKMANSREIVPFPAFVEMILMDGAFEILKEAGIRLPSAIGSTIGVVGGIIIGNAAVEAGLVSPIVVIIVALTAICGFTLPTISLNAGIRISKYIIVILSAFLGLLGFWAAILVIFIHLCSLKSFGFPYLYPFVSSDLNDYNDLKDTIIRPPIFFLKKRPIFAKPANREKW